MMDLGLVHPMAFPAAGDEQSLLESVELVCKDTFFDVLEVRRSEVPGIYAKLKAIGDQSGVKFGVAAQPGLLGKKLSLNSRDGAHRQAAIDEVKLAIDAAYELDARIVACLSGPDPEDDGDRETEMTLLTDSLTQLCRYAQDQAKNYVAWVSLETFDDAIDKRCLIGPTPRAADLADRVKQSVSNFGLTIDLSHLPLLGEDYTECIATALPHLIHIHVGNAVCCDPDAPAYGDMHPRFGFPGGENDVPQLKAFMESLIYVGFFQQDLPTGKAVVTFEVKPVGDEKSELILAQTKRTWERMWTEL
jgi:sugar phosphate isomerase/epimerase